ncbi:MAG: hypothetical protein JWL90_4057 [Chthoniobacteraceae bacterium]|nr:hypothetical protein [Chthoniobacteraceae bacterium]
MKPSIALAALAVLIPLAVRATPTENVSFRVLPVPSKMAVDGKVDDWDLSAGIFACDDAEVQRDHYAIWLHAQYDAEYLYLLARWNDDTPLNNPGQTIADYGFAGDSLQFRTITGAGTPLERGQHFTAWRGQDGADVIKIEQGKDFKEGVVEDAKKTGGALQAFTLNENGKGYVQELAIPWKLLTRNGEPIRAGGSFTLTFEPNFTIGTKGRATVKELFKAGVTPDRVFTFMSAGTWGTATLEAKSTGKTQSVRLADAREFPVKMEQGIPVVNWNGLIKSEELAGFIPIEFTMPADGFISLNIKKADGEVVRQLLNAAFFTQGKHTVKWDGLTTPSWTRPGVPVATADYQWNAITHTGIGLKLRGWAANGGVAPWDSADGAGNWGGDHGVPVAVATEGQQVFLGWNGAEAGKSVLACDLEGKPKWGNNRGGISGVKGLAVSTGVLYVLGGNAGPDADGANLYKLNTKDGSYVGWEGSDIADLKIKSLWAADAAVKPEKADNVSFRSGRLELAFYEDEMIAELNPRTGKLVQIRPTPGTKDRKEIAETVAPDGLTYTAQNDPDNQVLVHKEKETLLTIGRKGGRALLGPWQPDGMRFIKSMAVDAAGKLWVMECDGAPKRVSVWDTKTGKLLNEFFGSTGYGALGGAICPTDPNVMIGQGCEWRLDPQSGRARVTAVITRDGMENSRFATGSNGHLYLAVASKWAFEPGKVNIFERLGEGDYKLRCTFRLEGKDKSVKTFLWTDANGDELEQPGEVQSVDGSVRFSGWYMNLGSDLTFTSADRLFRPDGFTACGAPKYDLNVSAKLPSPGMASADGSLLLQPGNYGETHAVFNCFDISTGKKRWSYPDNFVGVHGSHNACPPQVGMIRGSYSPTGSVKLSEPIGNVWVVPTNVGEWHILTEEGFYLTRLFEGDPMKVKWPAAAVPGADMSQCPPGMGGEDFGGSVTLGTDGKLYVQAGKTAYWNLEVTGLETVKAIAGASVSISDKDVVEAQKFHDQQLQAAVGIRRLILKKLTPKSTGNLEQDFAGAETISFQKTEASSVRCAATWDSQNLYLAWDVRDATPWVNGAEQPENLYLSGDTVDFQLGTDSKADAKRDKAVAGDLRLSIGNFKGTPTAVIYRPVADNTKPRISRIFSSGVIREYKVADVAVLTDAKIKLTKRNDAYLVEAVIPLASLELAPAAGQTLHGDFGVTYGDPAGQRTRLRSSWSNQHTGIVDDAVFELMMEPKNWGELLLAE